jgi:hypothetical protein
MADCSTESDTASDALVEQRGHTPIVTMNSLAERNAFTIEMLPAMVEALDEGTAIPTSDSASSPAPRPNAFVGCIRLGRSRQSAQGAAADKVIDRRRRRPDGTDENDAYTYRHTDRHRSDSQRERPGRAARIRREAPTPISKQMTPNANIHVSNRFPTGVIS